MSIPLLTPVTIPTAAVGINLQTPLLLIGSCFSDEIGKKLTESGFDVLCNPFGTLYNPQSVATCLHHAISHTPIDERHLVQHDGLWHSWLHHSRFSHPDKEECLFRCNRAIEQTHTFLQRKPHLFVTFGTAWVFMLHNTGSALPNDVVANCHKLPANSFSRRRLSPDEVVNIWSPLLATLAQLNITTTFTVSPIRHLADGAHGNQLSKSTLLLAVDQLVSTLPCADYFDSYEILLDELRDYRFFSRDLCHPSDLAIDLIYERFQQTYMDAATRQQASLNEKAHRRALHRTIIPVNES